MHKRRKSRSNKRGPWEVKERKKVHDFVYNCHSAFAKFHEIELEYLQNVFFLVFVTLIFH